jgi:hypothetical protein
LSVKKVTIEKKDFPPLSPNGEYLLRYRIISEDKNRTSHWSPIYKLDASTLIEEVSGGLQISESSSTLAITAIWEASPIASSYDIFISFGIYNYGNGTWNWGNYAYHGSSSSQSYSFLRPLAATGIRVKVQLSGIEKALNPILEICNIEDSIITIS